MNTPILIIAAMAALLLIEYVVISAAVCRRMTGTWTCIEDGVRTYTIDLKKDHSVSCSEYKSIASGSWSISTTGAVGISIITLSTSYLTQGFDWSGKVDNMENPSRITGGKQMWKYNQNGYYSGDPHSFVMTR